MYSAAGTDADVAAAVVTWTGTPPSELADHGRACCRDAREWFRLTDRAAGRVRGAPPEPAWIRARWTWGPSRWPVHWCHVVRSDELDCGALAALASESLRNRGIESRRAQVLRIYPLDNCEQWARMWTEGRASLAWISGSVIYHEVVSIPVDERGSIDLWDPSDGQVTEPPERIGYGTTVAVRLWGGDGSAGTPPWWRGIPLALDEWVRLPREEGP